MISTHVQILDKLNQAYENEQNIDNAKRLVNFVENELLSDMKYVLNSNELTSTFVSVFLFILLVVLGGFISTFISFSKILSLLIPLVICGIVAFLFLGKSYYYIMKMYDEKKPEKFKKFNLYFQAKDQVKKFNFEQDKEKKEQELIGKYLDRNGNAIEVEKFKCDNPQDTIIVPHTEYPKFTYSKNLGTLCRAVIMQKAILPQQAQSINEKIAQVEFEKELPIAVIEMIDSCCTFNMHMFGSLYGLIKELNISEDSSDYVYIQQLLKEYEEKGASL